MKKLAYLLMLLIFCSCAKNCRYELTYQVAYPDTTWTNKYVFDGTENASYSVKSYNRKRLLKIYPYGTDYNAKTICVVPDNSDNSIVVLDYKIYMYGTDIAQKKEFNKE